MFYPLTVTVSPGATGPVYGMAGVRMTAIEAEQFAKARLDELTRKWRQATGMAYLQTTFADGKPRSELKRGYMMRACAELRSRGISISSADESRLIYLLETQGAAPTGLLADVNRVAFDLYSLDYAEEGFAKARDWAVDLLKTVQEHASLPKLVDYTADALWERVGLTAFDVPLLGTFTLADVRDNLASVDTVIAKIKEIDWVKVGKSVISTFAPPGGIADTGMQALGAALGVMSSAASSASAIGAIEVSAAIGGALTAVVSAMPIIIAVLAVIAIGEAIWFTASGQDDAEKAADASNDAKAAIGVIQDLVGASSSVQTDIAATVAMRCYEMAAYGSPIRRKLWAGAKSGNYAAINAVDATKNANGCWSDGFTGTRPGAVQIFGDNTPSDKRKRKEFMRMTRDFLGGLQSYLGQFETVDDRRIAFEYLGTVLIPPRDTNPPTWKFYTGLWAPTRPKAGSKFKVSSLPPGLALQSRASVIRQTLSARTVRIGGYLDTTGKKLNPSSSPLLPLAAVGALIYFGSKA